VRTPNLTGHASLRRRIRLKIRFNDEEEGLALLEAGVRSTGPEKVEDKLPIKSEMHRERERARGAGWPGDRHSAQQNLFSNTAWHHAGQELLTERSSGPARLPKIAIQHLPYPPLVGHPPSRGYSPQQVHECQHVGRYVLQEGVKEVKFTLCFTD
jgi:hypothetical protein